MGIDIYNALPKPIDMTEEERLEELKALRERAKALSARERSDSR